MSKRFLFSSLAVFCVFAWFMRIWNMDLRIAWSGWSPIGYVYQSFYPHNFVQDFPSGIKVFDKSAFMYIYKVAYAYLGISPENLLPSLRAAAMQRRDFAGDAKTAWDSRPTQKARAWFCCGKKPINGARGWKGIARSGRPIRDAARKFGDLAFFGCGGSWQRRASEWMGWHPAAGAFSYPCGLIYSFRSRR